MKKESHGNTMTTEVLQLFDDKSIASLKDSSDFIVFLHYCAERLNKGEPVQAIWNDYQRRAG